MISKYFILWYVLFVFLGIFNSLMLKWSYNKGISVKEQMACSRLAPLFLDLYLVLKYLRGPINIEKIVSILSGMLVVASFPLSYKFLEIKEISELQVYSGLTIAITAIFGFIILNETVNARKIASICLVAIAMYLLYVPKKI